MLYVIFPFFVVSAYVILCRLVLSCGRQSLLPVLYRRFFFVMSLLVPLMRLMTWMRIYSRKVLLDHFPIIIVVSGYTLARKFSMENPDQIEWVLTSLCENPNLSLPKESLPDLRWLVVV